MHPVQSVNYHSSSRDAADTHVGIDWENAFLNKLKTTSCMIPNMNLFNTRSPVSWIKAVQLLTTPPEPITQQATIQAIIVRYEPPLKCADWRLHLA